ncbi:MAG: hypothetical protein NkDv07_0662 [Candidatus Improbicoccus devescovinae]|nr:MAG: hypothetical protein NkDv07_0662 [Candidatus Improbicoccus devescovinae]
MGNDKQLKYKGKPLVRCGEIILYGDINENYIIRIIINKVSKISGLNISNDVTVQLVRSGPMAHGVCKAIKTSHKPGLYEAMDLGSAWLDRALVSG